MDKILDKGTNISLGDECSKVAYTWAQSTFNNTHGDIGRTRTDLSGLYANIVSFNGENIAIASDGIGTKVEVAERLKSYNTLGNDLVAMIVDDLVCVGAVPTTISNVLDVDYLDKCVVDELMSGLASAANYANIAITGGEIAELGKRTGGFGSNMHFNWSATGLGYVNASNIIDGTKVSIGDTVIALKSRGFRSNGFRAAMGVLDKEYGDNWHTHSSASGKNWGEELIVPSLIYTPIINKLRSTISSIKGLVHITGGGIAGNLMRLLKKSGYGAVLDNLFAPHESMMLLQSIGGLDEKDVYSQWNMGNGMLIVVSEKDADVLISSLENTAYLAKKCGVIIEEPMIELTSLGNSPQTLRYGL